MRGFADLHNHQFAYLGFGGNAFHGAAFGPPDQALRWCNPVHGPEGSGDFLGNMLRKVLHGGPGIKLTHPVGGHPKYDGWPRWDSLTHQSVHESMLRRAVYGGLRLMVVLAVNNEFLCRLSAENPEFGCGDMPAVDRQLDEAYRMQADIDERAGGTGKGWYRIVTTPAQAAQVMTEGKLAVVLGIEVDYPFDSKPGSGLTEEKLVAQLDHYHSRGVRHLLPIHFGTNAFGGCSFDKEWLQTSKDQIPPGWDPLNPYLLDIERPPKESGYEFPAPPGWRNAKGLTELGKYLVEQVMDRGWIVDVDHMSYRSKVDTFAIAERRGCPVVSGHTGFVGVSMGVKRHEGQLTEAEARRVVDLGGMLAPIIHQGDTGTIATFTGGKRKVVHLCGGTSETFAQAYLYAITKFPNTPVAVGTDFNGFAGALAPRFGLEAGGWMTDETRKRMEEARAKVPAQLKQLKYPFASPFDGSPMKKHQLGERTFDFNIDGLAHQGMLPDLVADLEALGLTDEDLEPLMSSAQGYLDTWQRVQAQSKRPELGLPNVAPPTFAVTSCAAAGSSSVPAVALSACAAAGSSSVPAVTLSALAGA